MKTVSLEEAMKRAVPGPLEADSLASIWSPSDYGGDGHVANCSHAAIDTEYHAKDYEKATAVLLAHAYNLFPKVVEALKQVRAIIVDGAKEGFNPLAGDWADRLFRSQGMSHDVVKKATTVELPE
jgi:hypothetical protein